MKIRALYKRLHLTETEFRALPECGELGPVNHRIGTRWKTRFTDGWFIGVWRTANSWSYEAHRTWYAPVIRCARPATLPRCESCGEPVSDEDLDIAAWEARHVVEHRGCNAFHITAVYVDGHPIDKELSSLTLRRIRAGCEARSMQHG